MSGFNPEIALKPFLPPECNDDVYAFILKYKVHFKIVNQRNTKLGDYLYILPDKHRITVNNHLNPYHFLFVTLHEFAHLKVATSYKRGKVKPHGEEWKAFFRELILPFLQRNIFPADLQSAIQKHMINPSASASVDRELYICFQRYDPPKPSGISGIRVEDIPEDGIFRIKQMVFRKKERRRTRYMCELFHTQRVYWVHGLAEVELLTEQEITQLIKR